MTSLFPQLDALLGYVVVITASNHPELIERAVWRRFQIRLELPEPTQRQVEKWFSRLRNRCNFPPGKTGDPLGLSHRSLARQPRGLGFTEVEDFGTDVLRSVVLEPPGADVKKIAEGRPRHWKRRFRPEQQPLPYESCNLPCSEQLNPNLVPNRTITPT